MNLTIIVDGKYAMDMIDALPDDIINIIYVNELNIFLNNIFN